MCVAVAVAVVASACTSGATRTTASTGPTGSGTASPAALPAARGDAVTFYLSLPARTTPLAAAALAVGDPNDPHYRHYARPTTLAEQYGADGTDVARIEHAVTGLGLGFFADPSGLFARVVATPAQWAHALGRPLQRSGATKASPFVTYELPDEVPDALVPSGTTLLTGAAEVYDPAADGSRPTPKRVPILRFAADAQLDPAAFPRNGGTLPSGTCALTPITAGYVYVPQQLRTAYRAATAAPDVTVTVLDLGGGWQRGDLQAAARCFGFTAPGVTQAQGDGVATAIGNADPETSLDLQTVAAAAPGARIRLVQTANAPGSMLDAFSRALADPGGPPDVMSLSYGGCALTEEQQELPLLRTIEGVLAEAALAGTSSVVAAGDHGSTTCAGNSSSGESRADAAATSAKPTRPTLSYPAVSQFVTAVGGTRLALDRSNQRADEVVWNDSRYGAQAAGGGGAAQVLAQPGYQQGVAPAGKRAVPDVAALADLAPGWPVFIGDEFTTVGGTSGAAPYVAANLAQLDARQQAAKRANIGLANGWFYRLARSGSGDFYDVTSGSNDLDGVGCCTARAGYDEASGLGVPDWQQLLADVDRH